MIHFVLLISRQGKVRLTKWYSPYSSKDKARAVREVSAVVLSRQQKQCNFLEYKDKKIIYKRCAPAPPPPAAERLYFSRGRGFFFCRLRRAAAAATLMAPFSFILSLTRAPESLFPSQLRVAVLFGLRR